MNVLDGYHFDHFHLDSTERRLQHDERNAIKLQEKPFDILCVLVKYDGRLVTKDKLIEEVWPDSPALSDSAIGTHIGVLRKALGDSEKPWKFIDTAHGKGYRFIAPIACDAASSNDTPEEDDLQINNIPYRSNPQMFFGRDELLAQLHQTLLSGKSTVLTQSITGLGGVGKTRLAVEFASKYANEYHAIFWLHAGTPTDLNNSYTALAGLLRLPEVSQIAQSEHVGAVKRWL